MQLSQTELFKYTLIWKYYKILFMVLRFRALLLTKCLWYDRIELWLC